MARNYGASFGILFLVVAGLELLYRVPFGGLLHFTPAHAAFHAVVGALLLANLPSERRLTLAAKIAGILFLAIFLIGVVAPATFSALFGYPVSWLYNLLYLTAGLGGLYAGFVHRHAS